MRAASDKPSGADFAPTLAVLKRGVEAGAMPGGVVCVRRGGQVMLHEAFGTRDGRSPTTLNTRYDLASLTKPMATSASLLTLVEAGEIALTQTVGEFLGEQAGTWASVTVKHLLTHTSGLPAWIACYEHGDGHEAALAAILGLPPDVEPGTRYTYSCLNFILLHRIIEQVAGQGLDMFARAQVFGPRDLPSLTYRPAPASDSPVAPTISREGPDKDTILVGRVHDGNARAIGGVSGNAGLFGTARDVARFGQLLLPPDDSAMRLFGAPTRARILTSQIAPDVGAHSLLFFAQGNGFCPAGDLLSPRAIGHSGYTGTLLTLDPTYDLVVALVTNAVYTPDGDDGKASYLSVRRKFLNAVAGCLWS